MDAVAFGAFIKEARLSRDLSVAEAAQLTHIRHEIIEALEQGDLERIRVSDMQLRGMLRNYLRLLKQDPDEILAWFDNFKTQSLSTHLETADQSGQISSTSASLTKTRNRNHWRWLVVIILGVSLIFVIAIIIVFILLQDSGENIEPTTGLFEGTANETSEEVDRLPTPNNNTIELEAVTAVELSLLPGESLEMVVEVTQRGWLKIVIDAEVMHDRLVVAGDEFYLEAENEIRLASGNAAGLHVHFFGETFSDLGERGQRIDLTFHRDEIIMELGPGSTIRTTETMVAIVLTTQTTVPEVDETSEAPLNTLPTVPNLESSSRIVSSVIRTTESVNAHTLTPTVSPITETPSAILPPRTPIGLPQRNSN